MKKTLLSLFVVILVFSLAGCGGGKDTVVIGGKNFTEQDILVYMMEEVIEANTDIEVETKAFLGGTNVVAQAIESGDLDIYAEYTGTALINILGLEQMNDSQAVYDKVKAAYESEKNIIWLEPLGFNNTYTLAMRRSHAEELGIETFSDLANHSAELTLGSTQEFLERQDGFLGLKETYNMNFEDTVGMDPGLTYAAVRDGSTDVNDAFSTDGRIAAFDLKVLEDDKNFFPPYYAAPIIRKDTLEKYPEVGDALNQLAGVLNDDLMSKLNAQVDLEGRSAKSVAHDFLVEQGLIK